MPANTPRLETERLVLRRFTPADVEPLFSLMRDREVNTFLPWFPLETEADAARYLEEHYLDYYRSPSRKGVNWGAEIPRRLHILDMESLSFPD